MATSVGKSCNSIDQALVEITRLSNVMETTGLPFVSYSLEFNNKGGDPKKFEQLIDKVIAFVSKAYALFPRLGKLERQQLREQGVWMDTDFEESDRPSKAECGQFENHLKQKLVSSLKSSEIHPGLHPGIYLSTDYGPEKELAKICQGCFSQQAQLWKLFPHSTHTDIMITDKRTFLYVQMNFRGLRSFN